MQSPESEVPFRSLGPVLSVIRSTVRMFRLFHLSVVTRGKFKTQSAKTIVIGKGYNVTVPEYFVIDKHVGIGAYFLSHTNIRIGAECLLSSRVSFIGHDHDLYGKKSAFFSGRNPSSVTILKGNNFIGYGATLCGNITLGEGAIVGAHSLVLESVPENAVVAGVPAKIIGERGRNLTDTRE